MVHEVEVSHGRALDSVLKKVNLNSNHRLYPLHFKMRSIEEVLPYAMGVIKSSATSGVNFVVVLENVKGCAFRNGWISA